MQQLQRKQAGFTLIELVVVIVILGILAATAIPRFADMSDQAKLATEDGALGAVRSASSLVRAQALVEDVDNGDITLNDSTTVTIKNGFASATDTDTGTIADAVDAEGFTVDCASTASDCVWTLDEDTACKVTYTEVATVGSRPSITDSNCGIP